MMNALLIASTLVRHTHLSSSRLSSDEKVYYMRAFPSEQSFQQPHGHCVHANVCAFVVDVLVRTDRQRRRTTYERDQQIHGEHQRRTRDEQGEQIGALQWREAFRLQQ